MLRARHGLTTRSVRRSSVVVIVLLTALLGACARPVASSNPTPFDVELEARLLATTDQRVADTVVLDAALRAAHPATRARAVLAIGQLKARLRYPQLRERLLDGDTAIAANAAFALGIAKDTGAVLALARALGGAPDAVAREAAWALGELGEPARTVLTVALGDRLPAPRRDSPMAQRAPAVRAAAVLALVKLRPVPATVLVPWLADSTPEVARAAAYVVGRARVAGALRAALPLYDSADEETRQHIARAATRAVAGDSLGDAARRALVTLLRDSSERVRINAVRSLETFGPAVAAQVLPLLRDPVGNVRVAASEGLGDVLARDTAQWRSAWESDTALTVRRTLLGQARRLGVPLAPMIERDWAARADWQYRVAALGDAAAGAGAGNAARDTTMARQLLSDRDPRVQRAARQRLGIRDTTARRPRNAPPVARPLGEYARLVRQWVVPGAPQPQAVIETERGRIVVELAGREAPLVVEAFVRLARTGVYRNTFFHRVVPNFVVQDGDASGDGSGDAGFSLRESWTRLRHGRGCLGLATAGPDTGGSQYYLCHAPQPHLDGGYTVFGHVLEGLDVMDRIVQGDRMRQIRVP
jgi:cyclophilin family peptidyl-prolyl cis-trans isomerase/HEAT repeat protein